MSDLASIVREWGAFGALFVLALLVIRVQYAKNVELWEARLRDLQIEAEHEKTLKEILGYLRQIQQQNRSLTSVKKRSGSGEK